MARFAALLLALVALSTDGCLERQASTAGEVESMVNVTVETMVDKLLRHELLLEPTGTPEILQIDEDYLSRMQNKYPAIFDTADAGDYEIRFNNLFVVYDYENDTIENQYVFKDLNLGG